MEEFLARSKEQSRKLLQFDVVHVVLGNEACDLDSIVSSLIYGLFLSLEKLCIKGGKADSFPQGCLSNREMQTDLCTQGKLSSKPAVFKKSQDHHRSVLPETNSTNLRTAVLPVLNIPKEDFKLRTEAVYLLERVGVDCSKLVFINDVDLNELQSSKKLQVTLVDHNLLAQHQKGLEQSVVEVIDHHKDEWAGKTPIKRTIEPVGSCATLVAERILDLLPSLLDKQMATLLLATIALDSVNLDPRGGRATEKDCTVVERLQKLDCCTESRDELYKSVSKAKFDVATLSVLDLMRKDYKALYRAEPNPLGVGICSVGGMELDELFSREDASEGSERFCSSQKLDVLIVMTIYFPTLDDPPRRQVAVCGRHPKVKQIADFLFSSEQLKLRKIDDLCSTSCLAFDQENITASRKVLLPLVNSFISTGGD